MENRFPPDFRVNKKSDYLPVLRKGRCYRARYGKILYRQSSHPFPRLGVIVSKKAARLSVSRNRVKRIARETFRLFSDLPNYDIVFIANRGIDQASNQEIRHCLVKMLSYVQSRAGSLVS